MTELTPTPTQGRYLSFIHAYTEGFGYPPADIGGVWGFVEFVEAILNPDHEQHERYLEWTGPFDPENFDPAIATRRVKQGLPA